MNPAAPNNLAGRYAGQVDPAARAWLDVFRERGDWLVCPHLKPDADTLGSALALTRLLRRLGCRVWLACADGVMERYGFLPGAEEVVVGRLPADLPAGCGVVTLDAADFSRLGVMGPLLEGHRPFVNLDHHVSNGRFGTHNWVDSASAATGELVYLLYDYFDVPLDQEAATALYAALVTDTGFFRYPATTARTLAIASELVATGIDFPAILAAIFERQSPGAVRLAGRALADLRLEAAGQVAWTSISLALFQEVGASEDDAEGIIEELRKIEGVKLLYILRESADGGIRVSLRARQGYDVNAVAKQFGGGGHVLAAGCTIDLPLAQAEASLRTAVLTQLENPWTATEPFGLLNVLKPPGMSSHDVVGAVRRLVGTRRVGHGGTLDPAAAGVMAVAVGKATRLLGYLHDDKAYRAEVVFGLATSSVDAEGEVIATADAGGLTREALEAALAPFRGLITQRPPMTSAVHVQGKRLYELARAGITLPDEEIPTREVTIKALELAGFVAGERAIAYLDITCTAGTYIRSLAVDLGASLGLPACLGFLLRTAAGDCALEAAVTLEELAANGVTYLPEEAWLGHLPSELLDDAGIEEIRHGRRVLATGEHTAPTLRLHGPNGALIALATLHGRQLQPTLVF